MARTIANSIPKIWVDIAMDDEELNRRTRLPECVHGMIPAWCAECRKISSPEEEELQEKIEFLNNLRSF